MKKIAGLLLSMLLIFVFYSAAKSETASSGKKLTLMVYMCGSNLESQYGSASADIQEMLDSHVNSDMINLLVMTGGSEKWAMGFNPDQTTIQQIGRRGMRTVWPNNDEPIQSLNMGHPQTLYFFMDYSIKHFPAEGYALIIWDHGGGPMDGVCWDELFSLDHLLLNELSEAITKAFSYKAVNKLLWIGFDACLMSSMEVAYSLSPCAEYMIASQDMEPSCGWNYNFLNGIENDSNVEETGKRIIDAYFSSNEVKKNDPLTLACIDLGKIAEVSRQMDIFFQEQAQKVTDDYFPKLSSLRMQSKGFGKAVYTVDENNTYDLVDLKDLVHLLDPVNETPLIEAINDSIVYFRSNTEGASGLSIYHPYQNKQKYLYSWHNSYYNLQCSQGYADYIFRFGSILTSDEMTDWSGLRTINNGINDAGDNQFSCVLTHEQAASYISGRLILLSVYLGKYYVLRENCPAWLDENGILRANLSQHTLAVVFDEEKETEDMFFPSLYYSNAQDTDTGHVKVIYIDKHEKGTNAILSFQKNPESNTISTDVLLWDNVTGLYSNRIPFHKNDYSYLMFPLDAFEMPVINNQGTMNGFSQWPKSSLDIQSSLFSAKKAFKFRFIDRSMDTEQMIALFEITDTQQNSFCSYPTDVANKYAKDIHVIKTSPDNPYVQLELTAQIDHSPKNPGVLLSIQMNNISNTEVKVSFVSITVNGSRTVRNPSPDELILPPYGKDIVEVNILPYELLQISNIETVEINMLSYPVKEFPNHTPHNFTPYDYDFHYFASELTHFLIDMEFEEAFAAGSFLAKFYKQSAQVAALVGETSGAQELYDISNQIQAIASSYRSYPPAETITFSLSDGDISDIVPDWSVMAESEKNGLTCQLYYIDRDYNGDFHLFMHIVNKQKEGFCQYSLALNDIQTGGTYLKVRLSIDQIFHILVRDSLNTNLANELNTESHGLLSEITILDEQLQLSHGQNSINTITISPIPYTSTESEPLILHLDQPYMIPDTSISDHIDHKHLFDKKSTSIDGVLLDWPVLSIEVKGILQDNSGFAVYMEVNNKTDLNLYLYSNEYKINQTSYTDNLFNINVMPHHRYIMTFNVRTQERLPFIQDIQDFSFVIRGVPLIKDPTVNIHFLRSLHFIPSQDAPPIIQLYNLFRDHTSYSVTSEPPSRQEALLFSTEVTYQTTAFYHYGRDQWYNIPNGSLLRFILHDNGSATVYENNVLQTGYTWFANEDGTVSLQLGKEIYTTEKIENQLILISPLGFNYALSMTNE